MGYGYSSHYFDDDRAIARAPPPPAPPTPKELLAKSIENLAGMPDAVVSRQRLSAWSDVPGTDCKGTSLALASVEPTARVVRGYALVSYNRSVGFTEHWWNADGDKVIDLSGLAQRDLIRYVPLTEPKRAKPLSVGPWVGCVALEGPCSAQDGVCEWCSVRLALEAKGFRRCWLQTEQMPAWRMLFDRAMAEIAELRRQLFENGASR